MYQFDIPKYLRRDHGRASYQEEVSCGEIWALAVAGIALFIAMFGVFMVWQQTRGEIAYAGIVRDGQIYTAQEFCDNY